MKKIFSIILLIGITLPTLALVPVKGRIIDSDNEKPLDFVNIALIKQDSETPAAGVISDEKGNFILPSVPNGKYNLRISFVGYNTISLPLNVKGNELNLGEIKLMEDSKNLSELEVVALGTQMRIDVDKKVFTIDQNIASAGGSATDALRNIPSVKVDNEGNVSLRKDANVEIWINGKPSGLTADNRAQILEQMPAESIESVEIMTNPSAKYNPEGTAGIINLVLKKNRKSGYYGSVSAGLMYPDGGKLTPNLGVSINYSSSKVDAYANIGYRAMGFKGGGLTERYNLLNTDTLTLLNQNSNSTFGFQGIFMRAGVDFHLNDKNSIGVSGFGMAGSGYSSNIITNTLTDKIIVPGTILRDYVRYNEGDGTRPSFNTTLNYKHVFDEKDDNNLISSLSYSNHQRGGNNRYTQSDLPGLDITQSNLGKSNNITFKADYTNKFSETNRFEAGIQSDISNRRSIDSASNNVTTLLIPEYQNDFNYNEQIHAAYITYGDRFDKLSIQGGLRAEYMWKESTLTTPFNNGQTIGPKKSFELFPSLFLSYSLPKSNEIQLNYTRRVNRPRGRQINPFRNFSDSTSISYGNPDLASMYTQSIEFNYVKTWENHTLSASVYHHITDSVIEDVRFRNGLTMENTYMNIAKRQNSGMELVAKNQIFKALNLTTSINMYYEKMDASTYINPYDPTLITTIPAQSNFSWSANILANFMLSKTFSGQITGEYSAPTLIAQGYESPEYQIDLGLRKTFFDRNLSLSLRVSDIFNFNKEKTVTWGEGFYQYNESYFHRRMIGITAAYNFGNMKPKKNPASNMQNNQEMNIDGGMD